MSDPLPTDPYDQGALDASLGHPIGPAYDFVWPDIQTEAQFEAYNAGYHGDPRPT